MVTFLQRLGFRRKRKPTLQTLPSDVISSIVSHLDLESVLNLRSTCASLKDAVAESVLVLPKREVVMMTKESDRLLIGLPFEPTKHKLSLGIVKKIVVSKLVIEIDDEPGSFVFSQFYEDVAKMCTFEELDLRIDCRFDRVTHFIRTYCSRRINIDTDWSHLIDPSVLLTIREPSTFSFKVNEHAFNTMLRRGSGTGPRLFLELVKRGHTLQGICAVRQTPPLLYQIVEVISRSKNGQSIDAFVAVEVFDDFVEMMEELDQRGDIRFKLMEMRTTSEEGFVHNWHQYRCNTCIIEAHEISKGKPAMMKRILIENSA